MPAYDTNFGAKRAREARERFGLGDSSSVPCVLTLAETHAQLPVIVGRLPDHIAGALWEGIRRAFANFGDWVSVEARWNRTWLIDSLVYRVAGSAAHHRGTRWPTSA